MELTILRAIQSKRVDFIDDIMVFFSRIGNLGFVWILISMAMLTSKRYRYCGTMVIISLVVGAVIGNVVIKNIGGRSRPCWVDDSVELLIKNPHDYSFPSCHTLSSFAAAMTIYMNHRGMGIAFFVLATLIGFSRLYLFVHYPTDVIAGVIFGIGIAFLCAAAVQYILV